MANNIEVKILNMESSPTWERTETNEKGINLIQKYELLRVTFQIEMGLLSLTGSILTNEQSIPEIKQEILDRLNYPN